MIQGEGYIIIVTDDICTEAVLDIKYSYFHIYQENANLLLLNKSSDEASFTPTFIIIVYHHHSPLPLMQLNPPDPKLIFDDP